MKQAGEHPQLPLGLVLRDSARFDSFFAGGNADLVTLLQVVARGKGESPVFLAGQPGRGKSHLLQATCHAAGQQGLTCAYLPLRDLQGMTADILDGLEQLQLVCVDDIEAIAGQSEWQTAMFNLFNRAQAMGHTLVFAGNDTPAASGITLPDLVTRLAAGPVFTLQALDEEAVQAALQLRARGRGLELPDETAQFLLRRLPRDLTSVFDLLDRLDQASMVEQRRLTIPFVKSVLGIS